MEFFSPWFLVFSVAVLLLATSISSAQELPQNSEIPDNMEPLFLEVIINDQPTNLIASFFSTPDGKIGASAAELNELGVKTPDNAKPEDIVYLSDIATLEYEYDQPAQLLKINIVNTQRLAKEYNTRSKDTNLDVSPSGIGVVANYSLFGTSAVPIGGTLEVENISANLDGWIYGPMGKIYGSGIISTSDFKDYEYLRLDTTWVYSDTKSSNVFSVGDAISGGLAWTRPFRFGGFQVQKNFGLRPDLIATPLFQASGSAAVPSTVDVFIGNFKAHSQKVEAGPFTINQIPSVSGVGNARIVITDATGREQETTKPFYIASNLLRKGLLDYSVEAGFARLNYGSLSNNYSNDFAASGTFRYGATDKFTLEGHVEGSSNLLNGGIGASFTFADRALMSLAASASKTDSGTGYQFYGSLDTQLLGMNIHASSRRSFGDYQDLASVTASQIIDTGVVNPAFTGTGIAKAFDQISFGVPLPKLNGGLNLSFTHLKNVIDEASNVATISYSQKIFGNASLSLSLYSSLDGFSDSGAYIGLSFPIGERIYASTGMETLDGDVNFYNSLSKPAQSKPGSWGWHISDTEGNKSQRRAGLSYRGKNTFSQVNVHQNAKRIQADGFVDGALVVADSGVFFANRISDAFAVVDAGVPDVPVYLANNLVGTTNKQGKLLVPGLLSYEENKIRIETENLPVNALVQATDKMVIPADGAGINLDFGVQMDGQSAVVIFTHPNGEFLKVGDEGVVNGNGSQFLIGFDGRSFMEDLSPSNEVTISTDEGECTASFDFQPVKEDQVEIGPVICH